MDSPGKPNIPEYDHGRTRKHAFLFYTFLIKKDFYITNIKNTLLGERKESRE